MHRGVRSFVCIGLACASVTIATHLQATEPASVLVAAGGGVRVRVQVSEGLTAPCDSSQNRMLFDGHLEPGQTFRGSIGGDCVCVRSTSGSFREVDWKESGFACRPRVCRGRVCRAAPDPTIRITLP